MSRFLDRLTGLIMRITKKGLSRILRNRPFLHNMFIKVKRLVACTVLALYNARNHHMVVRAY